MLGRFVTGQIRTGCPHTTGPGCASERYVTKVQGAASFGGNVIGSGSGPGGVGAGARAGPGGCGLCRYGQVGRGVVIAARIGSVT